MECELEFIGPIGSEQLERGTNSLPGGAGRGAGTSMRATPALTGEYNAAAWQRWVRVAFSSRNRCGNSRNKRKGRLPIGTRRTRGLCWEYGARWGIWPASFHRFLRSD